MKNNIKDIDELIKETLTQEEAKFYDDLEEQNIFQMIFGIYSGKNSWLVKIITFVHASFIGFFIYCAIQFFNTDVTNELIKWSVFGILSIVVASMFKMYTWMQMDKNALIREIKRLELLVSSLNSK